VQAGSRPAPEALLWLNPFVAQADVICGTETSFGASCSIVSEITGRSVVFGGGTLGPVPAPAPGTIVVPSTGGAIEGAGKLVVVADGKAQPWPADQVLDDVIADQPDAFGVLRDAIWPRFAAAWLALSAILVLLSVQLVTPTRRWHLRRSRGDRPSTRAA
jgi:hypothetical protein